MNRIHKPLALAATIALGALGAGPAVAGSYTLTFDSLVHGEVVTDGDTFNNVSSISVNNIGGGPNMGVAFDSELTGTRDPDLEGPRSSGGGSWAAGNIASNEVLGRMLIIQENSDGCSDGICDYPDDEGTRPAGSITVNFNNPITEIGFDLVDVESASLENGAVIGFFMGGSSVGSVLFSDFLDSNSAFYDPSIVFGNNSANRITPISAAALSNGLSVVFDSVEFALGGSGGIDNLTWSTPGIPGDAPEPGPLALLAIGLVGLRGLRRRAR